MSVVLVERLTADGCATTNKPMWLAFVGLKMPPPTSIWRLYLRRFAIDHWYRASQKSSTLDCSSVKYTRSMRSVEWFNAHCHARNYGWLVTWSHSALYCRQKSQVKLTPGRVAQSFGSILILLGTPPGPPKLRGKSPGWIRGKQRRRRIRYPVVKKGFSRAEKTRPKVPLRRSFWVSIFECIQSTVMHFFILS
jgi:hypothetical protein